MFSQFLIFVLGVLTLGYFWVKKRYQYWDIRRVPYDPPVFPFGSLKGVGSKIHISSIQRELYKKYKGKSPIVGMFSFIKPTAMIIDMEVIKHILVKDFSTFTNRGMYHNEKTDPLSATLFSLEDQKWKNLRAKLTPTFTSGKMKFMFPTIIAVAEEFRKCISRELTTTPNIEMKDILARFTTDVIGTCAFGIDCNSLVDPEAEFRVMGRKVFQMTPLKIIQIFFIQAFKGLMEKIPFSIGDKTVGNFFLGIVRDTIDLREKNAIKRNDFMDLLIELKNQKIKTEDGETNLTFNEIASQAFIFFLAGFETSSTAMTFGLYELAINQDIQDKARQEVESILKKYNGELTYEGMMEMKYIEQIINESLRKYPPVSALMRVASADYKVPGSDIVIEEGRMVFIPVNPIHHDPEYYPNPEVFDPNRFTEEEISKRPTYSFLPFGEGPRVCIGLRFGMMQARIGLATLLHNFKFSPSAKTEVPLKIAPNSTILSPVGGLTLKVEKL